MSLQVESPELEPYAVRTWFSESILEMGGYPESGCGQVVHAWFNAECDCGGCDPYTDGHTSIYTTDRYFDGFQLCPRYMLPPEGLSDSVMHEMGHVLRLLTHLDPSTHAMMTPRYEDRTDHRHYQPADKQAICAAGGVLGGVCGR